MVYLLAVASSSSDLASTSMAASPPCDCWYDLLLWMCKQTLFRSGLSLLTIVWGVTHCVFYMGFWYPYSMSTVRPILLGQFHMGAICWRLSFVTAETRVYTQFSFADLKGLLGKVLLCEGLGICLPLLGFCFHPVAPKLGGKKSSFILWYRDPL